MAKPQKSFPYKDNQALDKDLQETFDWISRLEVVSTIPDTNRSGKKGEIVLYISGATYRLYANVNGSTSWKNIALS